MVDTKALAASAKLPFLEERIRFLEGECERKYQISRFEYRHLAPFDHQTGKFLDATEEALKAAKVAGHRLTWELKPGLIRSEVEAQWAALQRELERLKAERDEIVTVK
jgi:uncharacterized small protein (DUF1192 family)